MNRGNEDRIRKRPWAPPDGVMDLLRRYQQRLVRLLLLLQSKGHASIDDEEQQEALQHRKQRTRLLIAASAMMVSAYLYRTVRKQNRPGEGMYFLGTLLSLVRVKQMTPADNYRKASEAPLSLLWNAAKRGQVKRALLMGSQSAIAYQLASTNAWKKSTLPPNSATLQSDLLETLSQNGCTDVSALPESVWSRLATPAIAAMPFVYLALVYRMMRNLHGEKDTTSTYDGESRTTFDDVAGMDHAVTEVSEVVSYLADPSVYHGLGARAPRAVLLYGPPGSGKTLLARAVAGEAHCDTFIACSGSEFVDTYVGRGASRVRNLFGQARREARRQDSWWNSFRSPIPRNRPASALVFIDEIDALARSRGVFANNDERDSTLNQLLTEMDGFAEHPGVTLIVIAATNRADVLDPAILRRFDRQVHVGYPDAIGREAILVIHANRIQCRVDEIDWKSLAQATDDFSGADLRNVVNDAALLAVRDKSPIVLLEHLEHAIARVRNMKSTKGCGTVPPHFAGALRR